MRTSRLHGAVLAVSMLALIGFLVTTTAPVARTQTYISGDIAGTVLDPSGAAIPGAKVTATSKETGSVNTMATSGTGAYRFSLLQPGHYIVAASATGFKISSAVVTVGVGQVAVQNLVLGLGSTSQTIEVTAAAQLLQTDSAQLSTQVSTEQLENIPNPGSDITYAAQAKPGVMMNTTSNSSTGALGYGNFSAFGLPGTSNNFTVNGMEVNDPFLNLNNSGPSNLLLGLNDIAETSVVTNAYDVQYGQFSGVQLSQITKSGGNDFHGDALWSWNGDSMNANNWFNKNPNYDGYSGSGPNIPVARPYSNFNQWAASLGGPIKKNKFFFFANTEGISFITSSEHTLYLPTLGYENFITGGTGTTSYVPGTCTSGLLYTNGYGAGSTIGNECSFYNEIFALYNGTPGYTLNTGTGNTTLEVPSKLSMTEKMVTGRFDANLGPNDKVWAHYEWDYGVQPTYTDPINPAFDASSEQPDDEGQFGWTHVIGNNGVNQFLMAGSHYGALFLSNNPALEASTFPGTYGLANSEPVVPNVGMAMDFLDGYLTNMNPDATAWPEGRNATQYQFNDDFSYTLGKHTFKTGVYFKKDDISDYDPGETTSPVIFVKNSDGSFPGGYSDEGVQSFPTKLDVPISLYSLGLYAEDDWKPIPNAIITMGVRVERNSNPSSPVNALSNFGGNFFTLAATSPLDDPGGPYDQQIKYGLAKAFTKYSGAAVEPRLGFTWSPTGGSKTVLRGGIGFFTDVFPGTIADDMLMNPPLTNTFVSAGNPTGSSAPPTFMPLQPNITTSGNESAQALMSGANKTFIAGFSAGGSFNSMSATPGFVPPSFTTVSASLQYPTYEEWNLQLQREFGRFDSIQVGYVGNHGYHEPNQNMGANAYVSTTDPYGEYGLPANTSPAPSFGEVNEIESQARSNYNGLIASYLHQGQGLTAQVNYAWSHALDEISNGGILPFSGNGISIVSQMNPHNLRQNYGNADYDVRQDISAQFLYAVPYYGGPKIVTAGWQLGGSIFFNTGTPFTPNVLTSDFGIGNYGNGTQVVSAAPAPGTPHHCGPSSTTNPCFNEPTLPATGTYGQVVPGSTNFPDYPFTNENPLDVNGNTSNPAWAVTPTVSPFGAYDRNQFFGPHYFDMDLMLSKSFMLPHLGKTTKFQPGITAFNVLNHPSFGLPYDSLDSPTILGLSTYAEGPPTNIYGSGLGGDPSIRIIEFNAKLIF